MLFYFKDLNRSYVGPTYLYLSTVYLRDILQTCYGYTFNLRRKWMRYVLGNRPPIEKHRKPKNSGKLSYQIFHLTVSIKFALLTRY